MNRKEFARQYLFNLILQWETLEAERQKLLAAATRITAIQAEKAELLSDAQDALAKFNQVFGTSYTLAQVRAWYDSSMHIVTMPPQTVVVPDVVGLTQAAATTALQGAGFTVSVLSVGHDTVAAGDVISSSPAAGAPHSMNGQVSIVVSTGPVTP